MKSKIQIIDEIVKFHPSYGVEKGCSKYIGGMADTGEWFYQKMLSSTKSELVKFLRKCQAYSNKKSPKLTKKQLADSKIFIQIKDKDGKVVGWTNKFNMEETNKFFLKIERKMFFGK